MAADKLAKTIRRKTRQTYSSANKLRIALVGLRGEESISPPRNKGTCDTRKLIKRENVEERILNGLKSKLLNTEMLKEFIAEYHREWNRLHSESTSERTTLERELKQLGVQIDKIVEALAAGMLHA